MFYVKEKLTGAVEVSIEISDENVFTRCPGCGDEVSIDLAKLFSDGESDLYGTAVYCDECSRKIRSKGGAV
jgi:hypothetical protein